MDWKDVLLFGSAYWLIAALCAVVSCAAIGYRWRKHYAEHRAEARENWDYYRSLNDSEPVSWFWNSVGWLAVHILVLGAVSVLWPLGFPGAGLFWLGGRRYDRSARLAAEQREKNAELEKRNEALQAIVDEQGWNDPDFLKKRLKKD